MVLEVKIWKTVNFTFLISGFKARRDMYGDTGHAHINTASFLSHCTTIITIFSLL